MGSSLRLKKKFNWRIIAYTVLLISAIQHHKPGVFIYIYAGEGNGSPLQYSCLENPRDSRAWWAAVYGVAQSRTRLTQLSSSS